MKLPLYIFKDKKYFTKKLSFANAMLVALLFLCGRIVGNENSQSLGNIFYCFMGTKLLFLQIIIKIAETNDSP